MLSLGAYAMHKITGHSGEVSGYGLRVVNGTCIPTLKVRVTTRKRHSKGCCVEDVTSAWLELDRMSYQMQPSSDQPCNLDREICSPVPIRR
jgi:hypothetical protein